MSDSAQLLHADASGPVATITLARPEKRNALTPEMLAQLGHALTLASDSRGRAIVLAGAGAVFCSGFDMKLVHQDASALLALLKGLSGCVRAMRACPKPIVIAAQGAAVAGGCALLAGADVVITDRAAKLGYPVTLLGISPAVTVPGLLGMTTPGVARERTLDPGLVSGTEALRIGLANVCCDHPQEVLPHAMRLATNLAAKPPGAIAATKRLLAAALLASGHPSQTTPQGHSFDLALQTSLNLVGSQDQLARVASLWTAPKAP